MLFSSCNATFRRQRFCSSSDFYELKAKKKKQISVGNVSRQQGGHVGAVTLLHLALEYNEYNKYNKYNKFPFQQGKVNWEKSSSALLRNWVDQEEYLEGREASRLETSGFWWVKLNIKLIRIQTPALRSARLRHHEQGRESSSSRSKQLKFPPPKKSFPFDGRRAENVDYLALPNKTQKCCKAFGFHWWSKQERIWWKNLFKISGAGIWTTWNTGWGASKGISWSQN